MRHIKCILQCQGKVTTEEKGEKVGKDVYKGSKKDHVM